MLDTLKTYLPIFIVLSTIMNLANWIGVKPNITGIIPMLFQQHSQPALAFEVSKSKTKFICHQAKD